MGKNETVDWQLCQEIFHFACLIYNVCLIDSLRQTNSEDQNSNNDDNNLKLGLVAQACCTQPSRGCKFKASLSNFVKQCLKIKRGPWLWLSGGRVLRLAMWEFLGSIPGIVEGFHTGIFHRVDKAQRCFAQVSLYKILLQSLGSGLAQHSQKHWLQYLAWQDNNQRKL